MKTDTGQNPRDRLLKNASQKRCVPFESIADDPVVDSGLYRGYRFLILSITPKSRFSCDASEIVRRPGGDAR